MELQLSVLRYTLNILLPNYTKNLIPLMAKLSNLNNKHESKLSLCVVPEELHKMLLPKKVNELLIGDTDNCLLIDASLFENSSVCCTWINLIPYSNNSLDLHSRQLCVVKAIALPNVGYSTVILTESAHLNVKQKLTTSSDFVSFHHIPMFEPSFASKAVIGLIKSPIDIDNNLIDTVLGIYFETPRYLSCNNRTNNGDIFSVDTKKLVPHLKFSSFMQNTILLFKVVNLEGPIEKLSRNGDCGYYVVKDVTTLLQATNQKGFIPCSKFSFLYDSVPTMRNYKNSLHPVCPWGLDMVMNELIVSFEPFLHRSTLMHIHPVFLLSAPHGAGKQKVIDCVGRALGVNVWKLDCLELKGNVPGYTEKKIQIMFKKVKQFEPCIIVLRNIDLLCKDQDGKEDSRITEAFHQEIRDIYKEKRNEENYLPVFIVGTFNSNAKDMCGISAGLARAFLHVIHMSSPDENARCTMLKWILKKNGCKEKISVQEIAACSSGFLFEDLEALVCHASRICFKRHKERYYDICLEKQDFDQALDLMQSAYSGAIGAPKIPAVMWEDIGGLEGLKDEIKRTITMPLKHPELVASGLRRSGILLYGPPGTGKTLLAKAIATECKLNFLSVKGPELLNMYVGQSEQNVREIFERARDASPCIIFFDELDSLAPNRGKSGDSAGVMDRVVSQLLSEMDGMQKATHLYVIGATNRPDLIDPALLRPGRFDKLLYVGVCKDQEAQTSVIKALTRKFELDSDVDMKDIVTSLPDNLTGADLFSVCSNAWLNAVKNTISNLKHNETNDTTPVIVNYQHFQTAIDDLIPSVTHEDLIYFTQLHQKLTIKQ